MAVKPKTMHGYRETAERYVIPRIGAMRLQAVRPATLSRLYRDLLEAGGAGGRPLSPATVEKVHRMLSKAFRDAVRVEQLIPSSPVERATRPRVRSTEPKMVWGTRQPARVPLAGVRAPPGRLLLARGLHGARRGQLLHLRWPDVDLDAGEVTFTESTDVIDGERYEGTTKGGRSRVVSIDTGTVDVMREHRRAQVAEQLAAGGWWRGDGDLVFRQEDEAGPTGAPSRPSCASSSGRPDSPTLGYTISGTLTRRPCSWPVSRFTSWLPAWATPTPASRSRSTPTSCASKRPE